MTQMVYQRTVGLTSRNRTNQGKKELVGDDVVIRMTYPTQQLRPPGSLPVDACVRREYTLRAKQEDVSPRVALSFRHRQCFLSMETSTCFDGKKGGNFAMFFFFFTHRLCFRQNEKIQRISHRIFPFSLSSLFLGGKTSEPKVLPVPALLFQCFSCCWWGIRALPLPFTHS